MPFSDCAEGMRRPAVPGLHPAVPGVGPGHADDAQRRPQARLAQEEAPQAARHRHRRFRWVIMNLTFENL